MLRVTYAVIDKKYMYHGNSLPYAVCMLSYLDLK